MTTYGCVNNFQREALSKFFATNLSLVHFVFSRLGDVDRKAYKKLIT